MILNLLKSEASGGIWDGIYHFTLSGYPDVSEKEIKIIYAYIKYEQSCGRKTEIISENGKTLSAVRRALNNPLAIEPFCLSDETEYVYHATDIVSAKKIFLCEELLSAVNVRQKSAEALALEKRNSPWRDPPDYFEYVMFCNGDDLTGDYVVLSESFPDEKELSEGRFDAGIRFYIRSEAIMKHPEYVFDGYHPAKVKNGIALCDYLHACIIPSQFENEIKDDIPERLRNKVFFLEQRGISLTDWNKKVFAFISTLRA